MTGILVGAVFLASIFMQTVLGYSALRTGVAFLPFALAITVGTVVARHLLAHLSPRAVATSGLVVVAVAAGLVAAAPADSRYAVELLPGLLSLGLGVGMVFAPVSISSMAGIPASHAGVASGFLMTGPEIGAARGGRPLGCRQYCRFPGDAGQAPPTPSRAGSSRPLAWRHRSPWWPCSVCRRHEWTRRLRVCACTEVTRLLTAGAMGS